MIDDQKSTKHKDINVSEKWNEGYIEQNIYNLN